MGLTVDSHSNAVTGRGTSRNDMKNLRYFFWVVDVGFILYWIITLIGVIPEEYLFKDYKNPILSAWNWSFLPLDLCVSCTGMYSIMLWKKGRQTWRTFALVSLVLTCCSGLQAIAFWVLRQDFDLAWWLPNGFLLIYPLFFIPGLLSLPAHEIPQESSGHSPAHGAMARHEDDASSVGDTLHTDADC